MRLPRLALFVCAVIAFLAPTASAADAAFSLPPKLDDSIARGLDYLARQQVSDGSIAARNPDAKLNVANDQPVATTGVALLAMLAAGDAPDVGRRGAVVRAAIDYLVLKIPGDGYVGAVKADKGDASRMYGEGVVTLALVESYGVDQNREKRAATRAAVVKMLGVILAAQAVPKSEVHAGGWGMTPDARDSDLAVSSWSILAIRACKDAGFDVPQDALDRAARYVLKCRNPLDKGFAYQPGGRSEQGTTAIAAVAFRLLDSTTRPELADAERFLVRASSASTAPVAARYPYAAAYFVVHASRESTDQMWLACGRPALESTLKSQLPDGGWPASATAAGAAIPEEPGRAYATAMAVLTLAVPNRLLPIYLQ